MTAQGADGGHAPSARLFSRVQWILFTLAASLTAAWLAWFALAQVSFLYPLWHNLIGIDQTIEIYAPQNRYRQGFEQTTEGERSRLFAAIVDAVHDHGRGLRKLAYHDAAGRPLDKLLRGPEVVHLRDVARLIDVLRPAAITASVVFVLLLLAIRRQRLSMPSAKSLLLGVVAPVVVLSGVVLAVGPVQVFYWLHTLIFPPGHEWFFYYQDSLMSTMMQAPVLFGYIAIAWGLLSLLVLAGFLALARRAGRSH